MDINHLNDALTMWQSYSESPHIEKRISMVESALTYVGRTYQSEFDECAESAWTGKSEPQWCGLFALYNAHKAGLLLDKRWIWRRGFLLTPPRPLRPIAEPSLADIAYFMHHQHHAICIPMNDQQHQIALINGNGDHGCVSLSVQPLASLAHIVTFFEIYD